MRDTSEIDRAGNSMEVVVTLVTPVTPLNPLGRFFDLTGYTLPPQTGYICRVPTENA